MLKILFGISITFNIFSIIGFIIIYKYGLRNLKRKIENYTLENFLDMDIDIMGVKK